MNAGRLKLRLITSLTAARYIFLNTGDGSCGFRERARRKWKCVYTIESLHTQKDVTSPKSLKPYKKKSEFPPLLEVQLFVPASFIL